MILTCLLEKELVCMEDSLYRTGYGHSSRTSEELAQHLRLAIKMIREFQLMTAPKVFIQPGSDIKE